MPRNAKRGGGSTGLGLKYSEKASAETPDDNFNDATGESGPVNGLAAKWTAVQGSAGTVSLPYATSSTSVYDLSTAKRARFEVYNNSGDQVFLRQDWTMAVGESVNVSMSIGVATYETLAPRPYNPMRVGITVNNNDSGPRTGTYYTIGWMGYNVSSGAQIYINSDTSAGLDSTANAYLTYSSTAIFRIARISSGYVAFCTSGDSDTWHQVNYAAFPSTTLDNLWFEMWPATATDPEAYQVSVNWIRKGTDDYDPWAYDS